MSLTHRKRLFYILIVATFLAVMIYEFLTPYMSDDIAYGDTVAKAGNFFDLFVQEYEHYMDHTGRSVAHIILRIFLFTGTKAVFNVAAALVFTALSLLIYVNVDGRKTADVRLYGAIVLLLWLFEPAISNTVFWESGACNYLFTTTIIMSFLTLFRKNKEAKAAGIIGMLLLGILAGWCNENTSGGLILFELILLGYEFIKNNKSFSFVAPKQITGLVGTLIGFGMLLLSPGNYGRLEVTEEEHTGLMALVARFLKITLNIKNNYLVLVLIFAAALIFLSYLSKDGGDFWENARTPVLFGILFAATCYALIMIPSSELRSYYGASIFLMVAVLNAVTNLSLKLSENKVSQAIYTSAIVLGLIFLGFTYIEQGANLARIKREFDERDAYLQQMADAGEVDVTVPMLRPEWDNRFSMAYVSDIEEDYHFWINTFYATHNNLDTVSGTDRENWTNY